MHQRAERAEIILWEMTYACPLRCCHCNTDAGRRPARHLPAGEMLRVADVLAAMKPQVMHLSGGEPLLLPTLPEVIRRFSSQGIPVVLSTSGFGLSAELARELSASCHSVHVSVDGASAEIHDRIRGRRGSFEQALAALGHFEELAASGNPIRFGLDCTLVRSNFDQMRPMVEELAPRFRHLEFTLFNCAVPTGQASRVGFETELLTDAQIALLNDPAFADSLRAVAPPDLLVTLTDNRPLRMLPEDVRDGTAAVDFMVVEPDGMVRALPIYEGVVGNVLLEPPAALWQRVLRRREHPFIVEQLSNPGTMAEWLQATRRINEFFTTPGELTRLRARPPYGADATAEPDGS